MIFLGERDKVRRFRYKHDAKASLVGHLLMQKWANYFLGKQVASLSLKSKTGWLFVFVGITIKRFIETRMGIDATSNFEFLFGRLYFM